MPDLQYNALSNELDKLRLGVAILMRDRSQGLFVPYTPALTASSVNPTMGTGATATGMYTRLGDLVVAYGDIRFGTAGFAAGTGTYRIGLPVAVPDNSTDIGSEMVLGHWRCTGGGLFVTDDIIANSNTQYMTARFPLAGAHLGADTLVAHNQPAAPWAWGNNYRISFAVSYRCAPY
jgi:hypothetical protein